MAQYEKAIQDFDEIIRLNRGTDVGESGGYFKKALVYTVMGEYDLALGAIAEAIRIKPLGLSGYYALQGYIYHLVGASDAAERDFAKAKERGYGPEYMPKCNPPG